MKYYKKLIPEEWKVFAFEIDGSQDSHVSEDMIAISPEEAEYIAQSLPQDPLVLDILRSSSTVVVAPQSLSRSNRPDLRVLIEHRGPHSHSYLAHCRFG